MSTDLQRLQGECPGRRNQRVFPVLTLLVATSLWIGVSVSAGPTRGPKRVIGEHAIDLGPLFKWWERREGSRPLSAWVHITGTVAGTNVGGWILEAQVERPHFDPDASDHSNVVLAAKILLLEPPLQEFADFQRLSERLGQLQMERGRMADEENHLAAQQRAISSQQKAFPRSSIQFLLLGVEDRNLRQAQGRAHAKLRKVDEQLEEVKGKMTTFSASPRYIVDCFALDLRQNSGPLPVYDHGRVLK